jgi:YbgC/YbaW family acyl-CoA thioester hydrolase
MPEPFRCTRQVEFNDTDMAGIAHFTAFFRWMEEAETAFLRSLGLTVLGDWQGEKVSLPRVSTACEFASPVRFGDELTIQVTVDKIGRSSLSYVFEFSKGDQPVARGRITAVFCQRSQDGSIKAREIPATMRALLSAGYN